MDSVSNPHLFALASVDVVVDDDDL